MAQLTTYTAVGNREDLSDIIKNISPTDTPIYSLAGKEKADGTKHEWQEEELRDPKDNAAVEGADYTAEAGQEPTRKDNYCQIFTQTYGVSNSEIAVKKAGIPDIMARRMRNAMKELGLDVEYAIINNTAKVAGSASVARKFGGIQALVTTNVVDNSGTPRALTEVLFNDVLQTVWNAGGTPDKVIVSGKNKRNISGFTASATKNVDSKDKRLVAAVDVYESDFGMVKIVAERQMPNTDIHFIQSDMVDMAVLRPFKSEDLKPNGDRKEKNITGEMTLVIRAEKSCGTLTDLNGNVA